MPLRVAAIVLLPLVVFAEVKIEVTPGLHGLVRSHRWGFLSIQLTNDAEETSGEVRVQLPDDPFVYTRKVDLPPKKRARVTIYFRMRDLQTEVNVSWVDKTAGEQKLKPIPFLGGSRDPYYLAAVWSARPNVQDLGLAGFVNHPTLGTDELPDHWKGYDALDLLVVDAPEVSSMTPSQSKALLQWIECGGRVIVVGEPTWTPNGVDPYLAQLLPCGIVGGTEAKPLSGFLGLADKVIPSVLKVSLHPRAYAPESTSDGKVPLWIREVRGCGVVEFLPFHPRVLAWSNKKSGPFWGHNLIGQQSIPGEFKDRMPTEAFLPVLLEPSQTPTSPIGTVTLFAFIYAVLVGPGVFWIQRRYRSVFTRALTFPAVVAGFAVLAFLLNAAMKDRDLGSMRLTLVYGTQDGKGARGTTFLSFISPSEGGFQITSQRDGAVFSVLPRGETGVRTSEIQVVEGATHQVSMSVRPWIPETFVCEWKGDVDTGIVSHLQWTGGASNWRLQGTIENTAGAPLQNCYLYTRIYVHGPFNIPAKGQTDININTGTYPGPDFFATLTNNNQLLTDHTDESNKLSKTTGEGFDLGREQVRNLWKAYSFYALLPPCHMPYKVDGTVGYMNPLANVEFDSARLSVQPLVHPFSPEVVLLGWRREDVSQVQFAGREPEGEKLTMYAVRLEVPGGR